MTNKWITFDLDGTLMQNPFMKWIFPEIDSIFKDKHTSKNIMKIDTIKLLVEEHNNRMKTNRIVEAYDWDNIVEKHFRKHCIQESVDITTLVNKHTEEGKVYLLEEGILPALQKMKRKGYKLAAITNGYYKYQAPVLKLLKLYDLFDMVITPEKVDAAKPDIKMLTSFENERVIAHVGDRIDHDICFANEANITSVLIMRTLPKSLMHHSPSDRIKQKETQLICQEKWNREMQTNDIELPEICIPDAVIASISELEQIL